MTAKELIALIDRGIDSPDALQPVRRLVLDLAVRGKLADADRDGEPGPALLERLLSERAQNGAGKQRRGSLRDDDNESTELPFTLPERWASVRLGHALHLVNGRAFKPVEWSKNGLPIIRIQNLNKLDAPFNHCDLEIPERFHVQSGDLLISWSGTPGTSFGAHIWDRGHGLLNQHIFRAELVADVFIPAFLKLAVNSRLLDMIGQAHGGVGLQHITKPKLERLVLPLPPISEQEAIVAKVDEASQTCDDLEQQLRLIETHRRQLLEASVDRALST